MVQGGEKMIYQPITQEDVTQAYRTLIRDRINYLVGKSRGTVTSTEMKIAYLKCVEILNDCDGNIPQVEMDEYSEKVGKFEENQSNRQLK